ncbi:RNA-directed DNA polymerase, eukaryota, reverse transcriptase zinc-binding domain protein [Tanacetum coccineum]
MSMRISYLLLKKTANKFAVLQEEVSAKCGEEAKTGWMRNIDKFVAIKQEPPLSVTGKWNEEMIKYYKSQRNQIHESNKGEKTNEEEIELDENDVFIDKGLGKVTKNNEVKKLIRKEKLCICAVLESHMKKDRLEKVCNKIYGNWHWQNNLSMSPKGCRVIVGWNHEVVQCHLMQSSRQTMCYTVEVLKSNTKFFCTFIYAANHRRDMKELWKDLGMYKRMIGNEDWVIMGDMNVILNTNEHSEGISYVTQDMRDFQDCINEIEVEDLCSKGLQYTWTKSLKNPNATVLKKLDRVMCNNSFISNHNIAFANFLPYGISDHSPAILNCPGVVRKNLKSFRLANYITEKEEFVDIVDTGWKKNVNGHAMYQLV